METSLVRRLRTAVTSLCLVVATVVLSPVVPSSAATVATAVAPSTSAAPAETSARAAATGRVRGEILRAGRGPAPTVKVLWFRSDWTYLGARKATGAYSLTLPAGRYFLQFVDQRPSYDVTKLRPTTVSVVVRAASTTMKTVRMRRGASIGGTVRVGGKPGGGARVVAANTYEQSFEVTADRQGNYALGGLPPGSYSVFTYDRRAQFVGPSTYLKKVRGSRFTRVDIKLKKRAGALLLDLYAGDGRYPGVAYPTAVSRSTGQFWTAKARGGSVTFTGLYPGRYDIQVPGVGPWLGATVRTTVVVRSGRTAFGSARLTKRGASVTGTVVDGNRTDTPLKDAVVRLLDAGGAELARTTSASNGTFTLTGQLLTQRGVSVVAGPAQFTPYLGTGDSECKYGNRRVSGVTLTTGRATSVGAVALPHLPRAQQDDPNC
ncbi:carboxypeptidase-like regulatory domain-containing protein [Nocardioides sp. C4-1]|uniref:MSCRAMM family protein n=1 Tax=Nocardioides sp. C4-1 TaxID=3151851 RepID=UPI0032673B2C